MSNTINGFQFFAAKKKEQQRQNEEFSIQKQKTIDLQLEENYRKKAEEFMQLCENLIKYDKVLITNIVNQAKDIVPTGDNFHKNSLDTINRIYKILQFVNDTEEGESFNSNDHNLILTEVGKISWLDNPYLRIPVAISCIILGVIAFVAVCYFIPPLGGLSSATGYMMGTGLGISLSSIGIGISGLFSRKKHLGKELKAYLQEIKVEKKDLQSSDSNSSYNGIARDNPYIFPFRK